MGYIKRLGGKNVAFLNYKKDKSVSFQGADVDAMPVSISSAYPEMEVKGVFSSWDTLAVNS